MTDKQSTVVVSRELAERIVKTCMFTMLEADYQELRALLAATPEQAVDVGDPVAIINEGDEGLFAEFLYGEDGSPLKRGDKLYLNPADKGYVTKLAYEAMQTEVARLNAQPPPKVVAEQLQSLISAVRSINHGPRHAHHMPGDDEPCYLQRKEWVEWILGMCDESEAALTPITPQA
jgi:hypothetical protein